MEAWHYVHEPARESAPPLPSGRYRPAARRIVVMTLAGLGMTLLSIWLLSTGLAGERMWRAHPGVLVTVGAIGTLFFGVATVCWPLQRLVVSETGARSRLPIPGTHRVDFAHVRAVVVFDTVYATSTERRAGQAATAARPRRKNPVEMAVVFLLDAEGLALFRVGSPPYTNVVVEGLPARVHRATGVPVFVCRDRVPDTALMRAPRLPHLVGAAMPPGLPRGRSTRPE